MFTQSSRTRSVRFIMPQLFVLLAFSTQAWAQGNLAIPGRNVDMVGPTEPNTGHAGDVLMQQNEVAGATSLWKPNIQYAAFNDYSLVYHPDGGDAVIRFAYSRDHGKSWFSHALPGFSVDDSSFPPGGADGNVIVLGGKDGGGGAVLINHMAFWRDDSQAQLRTAILYEHNRPVGAPATFLRNVVNNTGNSSQFHDKPSFAKAEHDPAEGRPDIILDIPPYEGPPGSDASHDGYPLAIQAARVHTCFTKFVGNAAGTKVECQFTDDLEVFTHPVKLSESVERNQGTSIALQQFGGIMTVCWTRFRDQNETGAIMCTKSFDGGETHSKAEVVAEFCAPHWGTGPTRPRYNSLPIVVASGDDPEDVAVFFSSRNDALGPCDIEGKGNNPDVVGMSPVRFIDDFDSFGETRVDGRRVKDGFVRTSRNFARIMMVRQKHNGQWDDPVEIDPANHPAEAHSDGKPLRRNFHQIMPACAAVSGTVTCSFFDTRLDRLNNLATPITSGVIEDLILHFVDENDNGTLDALDTATVLPAGLYDQVPPPAFLPPTENNYPLRRNMDTMAVQLRKNPATGNYEFSNYKVDPDTWYVDADGIDSNSVRVSRFATRQDPNGEPGELQQLAYNFCCARLFDKGKAAFDGDYNGVWGLSSILREQEDGSKAYVPNHGLPNSATDFFASIDPVFNLGWTSNHLVKGKVFYTGCDTWDEDLQMWVAGNCASTNALPEGALLPLVGEDADENPPMVCSAGPASAGPLTRNQTVMYAAMRPGVHAEVVSAIKGPSFDPDDPASQPSTFVINMTNGTRVDRTLMLSLEPDQSMRFDKQTDPSPLLNIDVVVPRGSSNARTIFDFGHLDDPDLASTVILTVSEGPQIVARLKLDRTSLVPLENVRSNQTCTDPSDPTTCTDVVDLLAAEFYELILKREILATKLLVEPDLDFENTTDLLDFEHLDFENLDFENNNIFLDFENLDLENSNLAEFLYSNADPDELVVLDLENLDFENRMLLHDVENLDFENQVIEYLDFENLDLENLDFENRLIMLDFENLDFENLDFENSTTIASDVKNLDFENLDFENFTPDVGAAQRETVSFTLDSGTNTVTGVDTQLVITQQMADWLLDPDNKAGVLLTVHKAYLTPTVATTLDDPENAYCTPQIVAQNALLFAAILTPQQILNAIYDGSVEDPPPQQADTPGFLISPDASLIVSASFFNLPANINPHLNTGVFMPTQAGDSALCDEETPDTELNPFCEFDFPIDEILPVISLNGPAEMTLELGVDTYVETATATDDIDGDITSSLNISGSVDSGTAGTYVLTYNVADAAGNNADTVTRTVHVVDSLAPTITLNGAASITLQAAVDTYTELGATVTDSGDPTVSVDIGGDTVDTLTVGTYVVTYDATDSEGNSAVQVTRTVNVQDTIAPIITLLGSNPQLIEVGSAYAELGAMADDLVDGDLSGMISINASAVMTATVGSYPVTYDVSDMAGNAAVRVTRTVNVVDTIAPIITLVGANPQVIEAGDAYTELGATATDTGDGDLTGSIVIDASGVDTSTVGGYTVTYDVSDGNGNAAVQATRDINVVDNTDPVITVVDPVLYFDADSAAGTTVDYSANVSVSDIADPNPSLVCTPTSGTLFGFGTTTVNCDATDADGNTASASFDVSVLFDGGSGVGSGKTNVKAGSALPFTWSWKDSLGNNVAVGPNQSLTVTILSCNTTDVACVEGATVFFLSPGSSGIQALADLSYQSNWQTVDQDTGEDLWPGDYNVRVDLVDAVTGAVIQSQNGGPVTIRENRGGGSGD